MYEHFAINRLHRIRQSRCTRHVRTIHRFIHYTITCIVLIVYRIILTAKITDIEALIALFRCVIFYGQFDEGEDGGELFAKNVLGWLVLYFILVVMERVWEVVDALRQIDNMCNSYLFQNRLA